MKFLKIPDDGLLQLIIQTLRRNAIERGLQTQGEMADLLVMAAFGDQDTEPDKVLPLNPLVDSSRYNTAFHRYVAPIVLP